MSDGEWHQNRGIRSELETQEAVERKGADWWFLSLGQAKTKFLEASFREEVWASAGAGLVAGFRVLGVGVQFSSVAQSCLTLCPSHGLQQARLPCPSPTLGVYPNPCPSSRWCHSTISSSVVPFSSCLHSFPASGSFPMSQYFASGGQCIRVSASVSVLPMNTQDSSPLGWTGWISLQSKGLWRAFSNTTVQ